MAKKLLANPTSRYFYPWPICLVTCTDGQGKPNIITIGASSICSSNPPTVGVAIGQAQYSLSLINETQDFGVNLPNASQLYQTDLCGTRSGQTINKFDAAGFTVQLAHHITAPLIQECPVSMECQLVETVHLGTHDWVIGKIVAVHVEESLLEAEGQLDVAAADPIIGIWGEYWRIGEKLENWHYTRS